MSHSHGEIQPIKTNVLVHLLVLVLFRAAYVASKDVRKEQVSLALEMVFAEGFILEFVSPHDDLDAGAALPVVSVTIVTTLSPKLKHKLTSKFDVALCFYQEDF